MTTRKDLIARHTDGEVYLTPRAMALICGVSEQQVKDRLGGAATGAPGEMFSVDVPPLWIKNGRRRIREAFAAVGEENFATALAYLDRLEGGTQ